MKKPHARRRSFAFFAMFGLGATAFLGVGVAALEHYSASHGGSLFNLQAGSPAPRFEWKSIDKKHWQAVSTTPTEPTDTTDAREGNRGACPPGMVDVVGKFKLDAQGRESSGEVEELQNSACVDWVNKDFPARCKTFDRDGWLSLSQKLPTKPMHYCIDRFEYPNRAGENPMIVVTYNESAALCKAAGKRLCTESEWTFACEGEEAVPYPYGYGRDAEACVVDRPWKPFVENGLSPRDGKKAREELDRLWQGTPSGSHPQVQEPLRRVRPHRQRRRVDQDGPHRGLRVRAQGRVLGPRARAVPPLHARAQRRFRRLPTELPLLLGRPRRRLHSLPDTFGPGHTFTHPLRRSRYTQRRSQARRPVA